MSGCRSENRTSQNIWPFQPFRNIWQHLDAFVPWISLPLASVHVSLMPACVLLVTLAPWRIRFSILLSACPLPPRCPPPAYQHGLFKNSHWTEIQSAIHFFLQATDFNLHGALQKMWENLRDGTETNLNAGVMGFLTHTFLQYFTLKQRCTTLLV